MNTLERLLARIGALRARWKARSVNASSNASSQLDDAPIAVGAEESGVPRRDGHNARRSKPSRSGRVRRLSTFCVLLCAFVGVVTFGLREKPSGPHFPNATLSFSRTGSGEFAQVRLQDSRRPQPLVSETDEIFVRPQAVKFVNKKDRTAIQIEWMFIGSGGTGDSYEFKVTGPSGATTCEHVFVANLPMHLLNDPKIVVTIVDRNIRLQ